MFLPQQLDAMDIQTIFTTPYTPQSNALCKPLLIQNLRGKSHQQTQFSSHDRILLTPFVSLLNSQVSTIPGGTPQELFFGRPPHLFDPVLEF